MGYLVQLVKMAVLAALIALATTYLLADRNAALVGLAALYLFLVRVS